jgi:ubiquinone/menaquinone biosynthesis C-methylase UbiE/uncharacterized protein YbaR (Trm112 family)
MQPEVVDILCDPYTHEPLRLVKAPAPDGKVSEFLESINSGKRFPFLNGIPIFYDQALVDGFNLKYQGFYQRFARIYDLGLRSLAWIFGGSEAKYRRQYLDLLEIKQGSRMLEVSIGTGANIALLPASINACGIDLSWEMLTRCQKAMTKAKRHVELFFGNAELLPFKDEVFDVVLHVGGINAFNDRGKAINEMIRVALPGTRIVIADETAKSMQKLSWMRSAKKMLTDWGDRFEPPVQFVPPGMQEIRVDELVKGYFYILSFRKP